MLIPNRLAKHALKMFAQISLQDFKLARNKYFIVT